MDLQRRRTEWLSRTSLGLAKRTMTIEFYGTKSQYGAFSNFARYPVNIDGVIWPTSEHYYQAQKYAGQPREEAIRQADRKSVV